MPKLGKLPPKIEPAFDPVAGTGRRLMLSNYLRAADLPTVADACDWSGAITAPGMHLNDSIGDCVLAMLANAIETTARCANATAVGIPDEYLLGVYEALGGYLPGDASTDRGLVEVSVLNWWRQNRSGFYGFLLDCYADLKLTDAMEFRLAVQLFGGAMLGVTLVNRDLDAFNAGLPWTDSRADFVAGGHALWCSAFNATGPVVATWNRMQQCSWGWLASRLDEAHAPLLVSFLNRDGRTPAGLDVEALHRDLSAVTS